jgi:hypothetical protein
MSGPATWISAALISFSGGTVLALSRRQERQHLGSAPQEAGKKREALMRRFSRVLLAPAVLVLAVGVAGAAPAKAHKPNDARLNLRATPVVSFAPTRIFLSGEIKGGPDDNEQFYCPSVEWDWGDGTISERSADCAPFEAGSTTIDRHFAVSHIYRTSGEYTVTLTLRRNDRVIATAVTTLQVRPGLGEPGDPGIGGF